MLGARAVVCAVAAIAASTGCGRIGFDPLATADATSQPRSQLTLSAPQQPLANFPLLVVLDDTRAARDRMQPDASDLRFFDAQGTVLAHEIEQLGSPGGPPLVAWVRVPMIDGPTTIQLDYGHGTPVPASTQSVWSDSYAAVYHLGDLRDATSHQLAGSWVGGNETAVDGRIAKGHAFDAASSNAITIADAPALTFGAALTISGWILPASLNQGSGFSAMVTRENGTGSSEDFWVGVADSAAVAFSELGTAGGFNQGGGGGTITLGTWAHIAVTYDGTMSQLYVDGSPALTQPITGGGVLHAANPVVIGADRNTGGSPDADFFDGTLDEIRLETVTRTPAWIAYDVASMRDEVITYGAIGP